MSSTRKQPYPVNPEKEEYVSHLKNIIQDLQTPVKLARGFSFLRGRGQEDNVFLIAKEENELLQQILNLCTQDHIQLLGVIKVTAYNMLHTRLTQWIENRKELIAFDEEKLKDPEFSEEAKRAAEAEIALNKRALNKMNEALQQIEILHKSNFSSEFIKEKDTRFLATIGMPETFSNFNNDRTVKDCQDALRANEYTFVNNDSAWEATTELTKMFMRFSMQPKKLGVSAPLMEEKQPPQQTVEVVNKQKSKKTIDDDLAQEQEKRGAYDKKIDELLALLNQLDPRIANKLRGKIDETKSVVSMINKKYLFIDEIAPAIAQAIDTHLSGPKKELAQELRSKLDAFVIQNREAEYSDKNLIELDVFYHSLLYKNIREEITDADSIKEELTSEISEIEILSTELDLNKARLASLLPGSPPKGSVEHFTLDVSNTLPRKNAQQTQDEILSILGATAEAGQKDFQETIMQQKINKEVNPLILEVTSLLEARRLRKKNSFYLFPGKRDRSITNQNAAEKKFLEQIKENPDQAFEELIEFFNRKKLLRNHPLAKELASIQKRYKESPQIGFGITHAISRDAIKRIEENMLAVSNPHQFEEKFKKKMRADFNSYKSDLKEKIKNCSDEIARVESLKKIVEEPQSLGEIDPDTKRLNDAKLKRLMEREKHKDPRNLQTSKEELNDMLSQINMRMLSSEKITVLDSLTAGTEKLATTIKGGAKKPGKEVAEIKDYTLERTDKPTLKTIIKFNEPCYQKLATNACEKMYTILSKLWLSDTARMPHPIVQNYARLRASAASAIYFYIAGRTAELALDTQGHLRDKEIKNKNSLENLELAWFIFTQMTSTALPAKEILEKVYRGITDEKLKAICNLIISCGAPNQDEDWLNQRCQFTTDGNILNADAAVEFSDYLGSPEGCFISSEIMNEAEREQNAYVMLENTFDCIKGNIISKHPEFTDKITKMNVRIPTEIQESYKKNMAYQEVASAFDQYRIKLFPKEKGEKLMRTYQEVFDRFMPPPNAPQEIQCRMMIASLYFSYAIKLYQHLLDNPPKLLTHRDVYALEYVNAAIMIAGKMLNEKTSFSEALTLQKTFLSTISKSSEFVNTKNMSKTLKSAISEFDELEKALKPYEEVFNKECEETVFSYSPDYSVGLHNALIQLHLEPHLSEHNEQKSYDKAYSKNTGLFDSPAFGKGTPAEKAQKKITTYYHQLIEEPLTEIQDKTVQKKNASSTPKQIEDEDFDKIIEQETRNISLKSIEYRQKMEKIRNNPSMREYYYVFIRSVSQVFLASQSIQSGDIERAKNTHEEKFAEAIEKVSGLVPVPGLQNFLSIISSAATAAGKHRREAEIEKISAFWSDPVEMAEFVRSLAMHMVLDREEFISCMEHSKQTIPSTLSKVPGLDAVLPNESEVTQLARKEALQFLQAITEDKLEEAHSSEPEDIAIAAQVVRGHVLTTNKISAAEKHKIQAEVKSAFQKSSLIERKLESDNYEPTLFRPLQHDKKQNKGDTPTPPSLTPKN